eukprot:jgi/Bigna1/140663/aug1.57_g15371
MPMLLIILITSVDEYPTIACGNKLWVSKGNREPCIDETRSFRIRGVGTAAGTAEPIIEETTDTIIKADGGGGFAQPCLHLAIPQLIDTAWENGICILTISNCRGILGTLWSPLEQISSTGLIAVGLCNTPAYVAWPGSRKRLLGTNPLGFGWPRRGKPPMVFDQASSVMSRGGGVEKKKKRADGGAMERLASVVGEQQPLPPKAAVDDLGRHVQDPSKGLSGAMLPFGGQKGANVALMVELLSLLAGGNMAFETVKAPGAEGEETDTFSSPTTTKGGGVEADLASMDRGMPLAKTGGVKVFLALSPEFFPGGMTASARAELLFEHMRSGEGKIEDVKVKSTLDMDTYDEQNDFVHSIPRLPGDKRYENRASIEAGEPIFLCPELYETLASLGSQEGDM